jgi:succinate dehydrogenase/fumarate reductase flavoprotein subunit
VAAERFLLDAEGRIAGLEVRNGDGRVARIEARRGVVLACGGFEANDEMKQQYWQMAPVLPVAGSFNTGDGIRMAQQVGADLWHMWHQHGIYGFRHPDPAVKLGIRAKGLPTWVPGKEEQASVGMAWIILDQDGKRYMSEHHPYAQDTNARPMELFDPMRQKFPRIPSYMILDERTRQMYPVGVPTFNQVGVTYEWSADNSKEIEDGTLRRADTIEELAALLKVEVEIVRETLRRWNENCHAGSDRDFGRPAGTLEALDSPPYYVGELWPVVTNTQGGPRHDARQRVIDVFGNPIPNLWAAGEIGSVFGYLYLAGGNLAECAVGGTIAGREAARNVRTAQRSAA